MENDFNELFNKLNIGIKDETQELEFYTRRVIAEIGGLLKSLGISYDSKKLNSLIVQNIYLSGKNKQNMYVNVVNSLNYDLILFVRHVINNGSTPKDCNDKANRYISKIDETNNNLDYEKDFSKLKKQILEFIDNDNPQINSKLNELLNNSLIELKKIILTIRSNHKKIFNEIKNKVEQIYLVNYNRHKEKDEQMELIDNFLMEFNDKDDDTVINILRILEDSASDISNILVHNIRIIKNKEQLNLDIFRELKKEFEQSYPIFKTKLNNEFVVMLNSRVKEVLPKNPQFQISRDQTTYEEVKKFSVENDLMNLGKVFMEIEQMILKNYDIDIHGNDYMKLFETLNIKKAELDNLIQKIENKILLQNIIEMQSKINEITSNRIVTVQTVKVDKKN